MDATTRVPEGRRIYAIGDIHGRIDLLLYLHAMIDADSASAGDLVRVVVYTGDYVDRGSGSFEVLDALINEPLAGFECVHLKGNHEDMLLSFLAGPPDGLWLVNGGDATLASYGVPFPAYGAYEGIELEKARRGLEIVLPPRHKRFLEGLSVTHCEGDYLFVHAGVRPGVPLDRQETRDLMWIREPFLLSDQCFGKRIVHGHTPSPEPEVTGNRIGIDTGAFFTGRLTCVVLEGGDLRFLQT